MPRAACLAEDRKQRAGLMQLRGRGRRAACIPARRALSSNPPPAQAERLRRMLGRDEDAHSKRPKHLSADDLNDGFVLDTDDRRLLSYKVRCLPSFLVFI